jgi:hypothetical protein
VSAAPGTYAVLVDANGRLEFVWDDRLAPLRALGEITIRRASHVEPTDDGWWTADMTPLGGQIIGPFALHAAAIDAEREWIARNRGL